MRDAAFADEVRRQKLMSDVLKGYLTREEYRREWAALDRKERRRSGAEAR